MKLAAAEQNDLVKSMLPMLREVETIVTYKKAERMGFELIASGIFKTKSGGPIVRSKKYKVTEPVKGFVNHANKIKKIIRAAKSAEQIENDLALYLAKNAKSLDHIKQ